MRGIYVHSSPTYIVDGGITSLVFVDIVSKEVKFQRLFFGPSIPPGFPSGKRKRRVALHGWGGGKGGGRDKGKEKLYWETLMNSFIQKCKSHLFKSQGCRSLFLVHKGHP